MSTRLYRRAFTLVELLIVITVIGILAAIVIVGYTSIQQQARDSQRAASATAIAEALEKYYDQNGEYPSCASMTASPSAIATTLPGIDTAVLLTPQATDGTTNSITCDDITDDATTSDLFGYIGDGSTTCATTACLGWTLQYREEASEGVKTIDSRRNGETAVDGAPTVTGTVLGYTGIRLNWNPVVSADAYVLQVSTDNFATISKTLGVQTTTIDLKPDNAGIIAGNDYYLRVRANSPGANATWSESIALSTDGPPKVDAKATGYTTVNATWDASPTATNYTVQISRYPSFSTILKTANTAGNTTYTFNSGDGIAEMTTYYVRVKGESNSGNSGWSAADSALTGNSSAPTLTAGSVGTTSAAFSWTSVSGATSYTLQRSVNQSTWTTVSAANVTSYTNSGLSAGTAYYYRVQSNNNTSAWSNIVKVTTGIGTPGTPSVTAGTASNKQFSWSAASCTSGTTPQFRYNFSSNGSTGSSVSGTWSSATTNTSVVNSSATSRGVTYGIYVQQRCVTSAANSSWSASSNERTIYIPVVHLRLVKAAVKLTTEKYPQFAFITYTGSSCGSGVSFQTKLEASWNEDSNYTTEQDWVTRSLASATSFKNTDRTLADGKYLKWRESNRCYNTITGGGQDSDGTWAVFSQYYYGTTYARYSSGSKYNVSCTVFAGDYAATYCAGGYNGSGVSTSTYLQSCAARTEWPSNSNGQTQWSPLLNIGTDPPCWP